MHKDSIQYYDNNAANFFETTVSVALSENQDKFLKYLNPGMIILDFGCGSEEIQNILLNENIL